MSELVVELSLALGPRTLWASLRSQSRAIALVGASGAGKSTLLRVVAGVGRRVPGTVSFDGVTWQDEAGTFLPPWRRRVGWVPQDSVLFPHLSVRQNLGYAARLDLAPIAELLGITKLLDRYPRNLSGGERQRVSLGRAMAAAPRLLLLDEPFAALDRPLRAQLGEALSGWAAAHGAALLVVSHDPHDVAALANEVWELRNAHLHQPPTNLRASPRF